MGYDDQMGDPRMTAFALGELEGAERAAFERELAADPALRAELADVRRAVAVFEAGFSSEELEDASLAPLQRTRVLAAVEAPLASSASPRRGGRVALAAAGLAAAILALLGSRFVRGEAEDEVVADAAAELLVRDDLTSKIEVPVRGFALGVRSTSADPGEVAKSKGLAWIESNPDLEDSVNGGVNPSSIQLQFGGEPKGFEASRAAVQHMYDLDVGGVDWTPTAPRPLDVTRGLEDLSGLEVAKVTAGESAAEPPSAGFYFEIEDSLALYGEPATPEQLELTTRLGLEPTLKLGEGQVMYRHLDLNGAPEYGWYSWRELGLAKQNLLVLGDPFGADVVPTGPADESYPLFQENLAQSPDSQPLSTFSIDVDTASYANVRRFLQNGQRPPVNAVRVEELVNYFAYDYARPDGEHPFAVDAELGECPWAEGHQLLRIGLRGRPSSFEGRAPVNVVFLIDVSGSMKDADKLPLLKNALRLLVGQLTEDDSIAIVTYASEARVHLEATHGGAHERILSAVEALNAEGSTNGEGGLRLAYEIAGKNLREDGVDRVLLASDGDFNVGISDESELETFIAEQSAGGVELTVLGFGEDNLKDSKLEVLSGRGNGNYFYVDGLREARKVLVTDLGANFETIASDVKIQVDFNPAHVASYRLIGYETRALANRDFADDTKDAGEIGPEHRVTALYEIVPAGLVEAGVRPSKYAAEPIETVAPTSDELCSIRLRYKAPGAAESVEFEEPVLAGARPFSSLTADTRFATAVTAFGLALRNSKHRGTATLEDVSRWALDALGDDPEGLRTEFCDLVGKSRELGVK